MGKRDDTNRDYYDRHWAGPSGFPPFAMMLPRTRRMIEYYTGTCKETEVVCVRACGCLLRGWMWSASRLMLVAGRRLADGLLSTLVASATTAQRANEGG